VFLPLRPLHILPPSTSHSAHGPAATQKKGQTSVQCDQRNQTISTVDAQKTPSPKAFSPYATNHRLCRAQKTGQITASSPTHTQASSDLKHGKNRTPASSDTATVGPYQGWRHGRRRRLTTRRKLPDAKKKEKRRRGSSRPTSPGQGRPSQPSRRMGKSASGMGCRGQYKIKKKKSIEGQARRRSYTFLCLDPRQKVSSTPITPRMATQKPQPGHLFCGPN